MYTHCFPHLLETNDISFRSNWRGPRKVFISDLSPPQQPSRPLSAHANKDEIPHEKCPTLAGTPLLCGHKVTDAGAAYVSQPLECVEKPVPYLRAGGKYRERFAAVSPAQPTPFSGYWRLHAHTCILRVQLW
ncbi:hypothetical protein EVAR_10633_1 [Eumeta japonica]|uniref:Uncharacterized protein n=1 Tax=Eumeta variegata TaxID=151549 RepID=A0A4C1U288_EUMVA|nr:hypothetical protein EVAR_10633_1 [Eumeta japonica]